ASVVDADTGRGLPGFRAEERTFQLVTQLAGRSGRDAPGRVLVQTFQPDARAIALAANHDVERFLSGELERRRELGYPPFRHLVRIVVSGAGPDAPLQALSELRAGLPDEDVLGPAPLLRLRGRYRAQLVATNDASMSFDDPLDTMVFTTRRVAELKYPVLVVSHDAEDGAWQFLCGTTNDPKDGVTVSLASMLERHPELEELSDLARGWIAWRETERSTWVRAPHPPGDA